jgi:hypothetical protein
LDVVDLSLLRAYTLKVEDGLTDMTFNKLRLVFPESSVETLKNTMSRVRSLSGFEPIRYACCPDSCVCFTGPYEDLSQCPKCGTARYNSDGKPQAYFTYLPLIPRLRAMVACSSFAQKLQYRFNHQHDPEKMTDVFDGIHFRTLQDSFISIAGEQLPSLFFSDSRDIALGLSTDGFALFKRRTKAAWPLVVFNYNLPPEERFQKRHLISLGVVPKKPWDMDSFLWPAVQEFLQLEIGVSAFDAISKSIFRLHAFLIFVFGDIPAISMIMRMKGHNAIVPCRMCEIRGIRIPSSRCTTHYVPLSRVNFPRTVQPRRYDPAALPLRDHDTLMGQAEEVQTARTSEEAEELAKKYGIKGVPILSALSSLSFPRSFPYDFMHLIWTNLIPNLTLLWTGSFKDIDHDDKGYVIAKTVWDAICKAGAAAGSTIPAAFGSRVPNLASEKNQMTAETYSIWTLYLAPALLKNRFLDERYYKHFVLLVGLLTTCLQFEITPKEIDDLEIGFRQWVQEYER